MRLARSIAVGVILLAVGLLGSGPTDAVAETESPEVSIASPANRSIADSTTLDVTLEVSGDGEFERVGVVVWDTTGYFVSPDGQSSREFASVEATLQPDGTYRAYVEDALLPGRKYRIRAHAVDRSGDRTSYRPIVRVFTPRDTTPPTAEIARLKQSQRDTVVVEIDASDRSQLGTAPAPKTTPSSAVSSMAEPISTPDPARSTGQAKATTTGSSSNSTLTATSARAAGHRPQHLRPAHRIALTPGTDRLESRELPVVG